MIAINFNKLKKIRSIAWRQYDNSKLVDRILNGSLNVAPETVVDLDRCGCDTKDIAFLNGVIGETVDSLPKASKIELKRISKKTGIDFMICDRQVGFAHHEIRVLQCCTYQKQKGGMVMNTFTLLRLNQSQFFA